MKKLLVLLTILSSIIAYAEDTIELDQTTVKSSPRSSDYTLIPKEQKNTYVITQEKIRERNYKNVEDVLRDAPGVTIQNTAFGPRVDMRGSGEKSLSRVKVLIDGVSINPTEETMASLPINSIPIESVKKILREEGIQLVAEDTGANYARTMSLDTGTGEVLIRTYGRDDVRI